MTLEDLHVFAIVADHLNLSAAANALGRTQPAISQHVRRLEQELGIVLLERGRRGVELSEAGELLAFASREVLSTLSRARRSIAELADPFSGVVRVATGGSTVRHFMAQAISAFRSSHPNVVIEFHSANTSRRCLDAVRRDEADLAFVTLSRLLPDLDTLVVVESGWTLVESLDQPELTPDCAGLSARELPGEDTYISLRPGSVAGQALTDELDDIGVVLQPVTTVDDWDTAVTLVELKLGWALVPALHAQALAASNHRVRVTPITDLAPIRFGWAAMHHDMLSATAKAFLDVFLSHHALPDTSQSRVFEPSWQTRGKRTDRAEASPGRGPASASRKA